MNQESIPINSAADTEVLEVEEGDRVDSEFVGEGQWDAVARRMYYTQIAITCEGETERFQVGDCVRVLSSSEEEPDWPCRIEKLWETEDKQIRFEARWFFNASEIQAHENKFVGPISREYLISQMERHEVVLSDETDENDCTGILSKIDVRFRDQIPADLPPSDPSLPKQDILYCRYFLITNEPDIDQGVPGLTSVSHFSESRSSRLENHTRATGSADEKPPAADENGSVESETSNDSNEENGSAAQPHVQVEGEGSSLRGEIQVGKNYQVEVPPFKPGLTAGDRKPTLIWKKGAIENGELHSFLQQVAVLHNTYLDKHGLSMEEPYSPLPTGPTEHWMKLQSGRSLTGSFMSTASMLASTGVESGVPSRKTSLRKECDPDEVLRILSEHKYDTKAALADIKSRLGTLNKGAWSHTERDAYDDGFRHHQTDLRRIAKSIMTRSVKDTIDFHFRYKIPDQFRVFQHRKREQAVRMVECIEARRYQDAIQGNPPNEGNKRRRTSMQSGHWTETVASDVPNSLEGRRRQARELLLEVHESLGARMMVRMGELLKEMDENESPEKREALLGLVAGNALLKRRLAEFFPAHD